MRLSHRIRVEGGECDLPPSPLVFTFSHATFLQKKGSSQESSRKGPSSEAREMAEHQGVWCGISPWEGEKAGEWNLSNETMGVDLGLRRCEREGDSFFHDFQGDVLVGSGCEFLGRVWGVKVGSFAPVLGISSSAI